MELCILHDNPKFTTLYFLKYTDAGSAFQQWRNPKKIKEEELRPIVNSTKPTGVWWSGHNAEVDWAKHINDAVSSKIGKLNSSRYKSLPEYMLHIFKYLSLPNVHATIATEILLSEDSHTKKDS